METKELVSEMIEKKVVFYQFLNKYWDALPDTIRDGIYDNLSMENARVKILYNDKKQVSERMLQNESLRIINNLTTIDNKYFKGRIFSEQ